MSFQELAAVGAALNLLAALVGFPVLWWRVKYLEAEVHELRGNVRQLELTAARQGPNPGGQSHGEG